jgi:O-antigen/teichoic acid export membrane protein
LTLAFVLENAAMTLKRQFLWSMAPLAVITVVNVFSVPLFYRYLGADLCALWFYVSTFVGMFGFADLGLGVAVGRYIGVALGKGDHQAVREYWGTGNMIALPLLALMALVFVAVGVLWGPHWFNVAPENEKLLRLCFIPTGLSLFFNFYGQIWNILLQAHLDFKFSSILRITASLLQVIPAVAIAYFTHNPLWINTWGVVLSIAQLVFFMWYVSRRYHLGFDFAAASISRAREMASFVGKTFAMILVNSVFNNVDRVVLGKIAPAASFTHYTIAANAGVRLQGLGTSVMGPVFYNTNQALGGGKTASTAKIYNETFNFVFGWYLLAAVWAVLWHPVLLRLWLGPDLAAKIAPLFCPIIVACCFTAIGNISAAQLSALNRLGTSLWFTIGSGLLTIAGVVLGWRFGGIVGVAYGFLASRIGVFAQDLFAIRLMKAGGWLSRQTWLSVGWQAVAAVFFGSVSLFVRRDSYWLLIPAIAHGTIISIWLMRHVLRKILSGRAAPADAMQPVGANHS